MNHDIVNEAEDIVSKTYEKEKMLDEALGVTKGMYDEYIHELKELWNESEADLLYALIELKSIKRKLDSFGETPKVFEKDIEANRKTEYLLEEFFKLLPDRESSNLKFLEDIYEHGNLPYIYGDNVDGKGFRDHLK